MISGVFTTPVLIHDKTHNFTYDVSSHDQEHSQTYDRDSPFTDDL